MPPSNIVRGIRTHIQKQLIPTVPKRWTRQFSFGLQAYSFKSFQSANGNARTVTSNPTTAATKTERLLANTKLAESLGKTLDSLRLVRENSYVNVDHSDMHELLALVGAVQTRKGRALPVMVEATYASTISSVSDKPHIQKLRQAMVESRQAQSFTGHCLDSLQNFHDRLGFWPKLVFDRGFGNESLVNHLSAEGATFYVRLKEGRYVEFDGQKTEVKRLTDKDAVVKLFGLQLRIVRSPRNRRCKQPWYILTNDFTSSRDKIVKIYYHRFEIEETFKDIKHIWELKRTRFSKPNSLKTILWFVSLGIALLYLNAKTTKHIAHCNPKKQVSWLRQAYEQYQQAITASLMLSG